MVERRPRAEEVLGSSPADVFFYLFFIIIMAGFWAEKRQFLGGGDPQKDAQMSADERIRGGGG